MQNQFIPFAGDTHHLQRKRTVASNWFMKMAESNVPRVAQGNTAQGFYVIAADGTFYGYNNNRSIERVNSLLDKGLAGFKQNPPQKVEITSEELEAATCVVPPPNTSSLRIFTRIRPVPARASPTNNSLARDHIWVLQTELEQIAKQPGPTLELPKTLVRRILRFHLVDNVRGEPEMWTAANVLKSQFAASWTDRSKCALQFNGAFKMAAQDSHVGIEGTIQGEMTIDKSRNKIERFRAFANATAWGHGQWTPDPPPGKFSMVFAIVDASDELTKCVPPQAAQYGLDYINPN